MRETFGGRIRSSYPAGPCHQDLLIVDSFYLSVRIPSEASTRLGCSLETVRGAKHERASKRRLPESKWGPTALTARVLRRAGALSGRGHPSAGPVRAPVPRSVTERAGKDAAPGIPSDGSPRQPTFPSPLLLVVERSWPVPGVPFRNRAWRPLPPLPAPATTACSRRRSVDFPRSPNPGRHPDAQREPENRR